MTYKERYDKRKPDELRPIEAKAGILNNATGSAYFKIGNTIAYAAVYGPRNLHPKFLQDPKKGLLRCHYNMMPFSGQGNRVRPGSNRRAKEISMVTEKSLSPVIDLTNFPNAVVDVFIELPQTDAGSRCAGICAAAIALADAGIPMKDLVAAVSVGYVDGMVCVDLDYAEEAHEEGDVADIPIAMIQNTNEISLLQADGSIEKKNLMKALEMGKVALGKIFEAQKNALKEQFKVDQK